MAALKHKRFYHVGPTSNYMHKVSNRSMSNTWRLFKVFYEDNKTDLFIVNIKQISHLFWRIKIRLGIYLFKFFSMKLYSQYLQKYIIYYLSRYYILVGLFFKKGILEYLVKIIDKYTYKEFLKISFENWTSSQMFFKDFDHSCENNSLKYDTNRTLFP